MPWLFDTNGFPPRWNCGTGWTAALGWTHVASDLVMTAAFFAVPFAVWLLARRGLGKGYGSLLFLFAATFTLCGVVHLLEAVIFWVPLYRLAAVMKFATACVSLVTVAVLLRALPRILALPEEAARADVLEGDVAVAEEARSVASSASAAKTRFLAGMSHEIRTPLAALLGYLDVLTREVSDPEQLSMLRTMRHHGEYLLTLLSDILDLSKVEAGKLRVVKEPVELVPLVSEVHSLMHARAAERGIAFEVGYADRVPGVIETDPVRLKQILLNLLSNAVKFTEEGAVRMTVRHEVVPDGDRDEDRDKDRDGAADGDRGEDPGRVRMVFEVSDTGIGMTPEQVGRLFRPFTQAEDDTHRRFGGTGLGLSISRTLAEMLGGTITVDSAAGEGSTFRVTIDSAPADAVELIDPLRGSDPLRKVLAGPAEEGTPLPDLTCRVLLAEDTASLRTIATRLLTRAGAEVVAVADGAEALAAWGAEPGGFGVILMDMRMPNVDGFEAVARLRAGGCGVPIVALTAGAMNEDRDRCLDIGCDAYLSKPVDFAELVRTVAELGCAARAG